VLGAPDRRSPVDLDLAFQNAPDAAFHGFLALPAQIARNKPEGGRPVRDIRNERHHTDHGVVVEGDMLLVPAGAGKPLWPAPVAVLAVQQVSNPAPGGFLEAFVAGLREARGEQADLGVSGPVVDGGIVPASVLAESAELRVGQGLLAVIILRPATALALVGKDILDRLPVRPGAGRGRAHGRKNRGERHPHDPRETRPPAKARPFSAPPASPEPPPPSPTPRILPNPHRLQSIHQYPYRSIPAVSFIPLRRLP